MKTAIVDDDPIVCESLRTILTATGAAEVLWTAPDGERAVERYRSGPHDRPDVLLIDIQMPGIGGLEAARRILAFDRSARVLFLTTFSDRAYIDEAIALGARGYLIKQDVASVGPALQAVMAGQVVLGAEVLGKLAAPAEDAESRDTDPSEAADAFPELSDRELEIAALVAEGFDNRDIAARLYLSPGTVRNRISGILDKLGMANRTQLAIAWIRRDRR
ncbi:response regulator transcription factor [Bifidobacterium phasiani]|uniref:Response regulator transcription factor n=1 Tax=Bifidobacterium phasiani TaxID=2834431 RepID=A0ABS6W5P7_9BIFI|nr:response regulator transcription factor [Bifidobacterium phasiani]MBW3081816.1 response regulator transcription factor [Bifidobacterium phasiani]